MSIEILESQSLRIGQERIKDAMFNVGNKQKVRSYLDDDSLPMSFGDIGGQQFKQMHNQIQDDITGLESNQIEQQNMNLTKQRSQEYDTQNKSDIQILNPINASSLLNQSDFQEMLQEGKLNQKAKGENYSDMFQNNQPIESNDFVKQKQQQNRFKSKTDHIRPVKKTNKSGPQKWHSAIPFSEKGQTAGQSDELKISKGNFLTQNFQLVRRFMNKLKQSSQLNLFKNLKSSQFKMIHDCSAEYEYYIYQKNLIIPEVYIIRLKF